MEKLKAKHDHKLTDILKVCIFAIVLLLPFMAWLPSCLYYGHNEHATAPTTTTEIYEYKQINFNQLANENNFYRETFNNNVATWNLDAVNSNVIIYVDNLQVGHIYYYRHLVTFTEDEGYAIPRVYINGTGHLLTNSSTYQNYRFQASTTNFYVNFGSQYIGLPFIANSSLNVFDLTQMFGSGNEPTKENFDTWFTDYYYNYTQTEPMTIEIDTGTTETFTDITKQINYNWESVWKQPLFSWTNYTVLKQGLNSFTGVFGITDTSYITNLIVYELIIVAIYIVIDIVITIFKWLTHLIGEK